MSCSASYNILSKSQHQQTYLRLRHYPLYHLLTGIAWASSFHSAGKDPAVRVKNTQTTLLVSVTKQSNETVAADSFNVLSSANLNELLVALGAALLAVALQQLAQQADTLLHFLDGVYSL